MRTDGILGMVILALAAAVGTAPAAEQEQRVFELRTYDSPAGRLDDLHARFRDYTLELFDKHGLTSIGYWVPIDNPDNQLIFLLAFPSREAREAAWKSFVADPRWQEARKKTEADGPIVSKVQSVLLGPTDYSPVVQPSKADAERVFEMRTYIASPGNLDHLNARFGNHTVRLFEKHGIENIGYWCPLEGQPGAGEVLIYIIGHESVEAAEKSFGAFRQDPDWLAARKASEEKAGGSLTAPGGVQSLMMKATDYSPMR
jgi:hypothetical protein